jgi:hypothetical protein
MTLCDLCIIPYVLMRIKNTVLFYICALDGETCSHDSRKGLHYAFEVEVERYVATSGDVPVPIPVTGTGNWMLETKECDDAFCLSLQDDARLV